MSAEEVNRLLDYNVSLGSSPAPSASPLSGVNSQGTLFSDSFSGGVRKSVYDSLGVPVFDATAPLYGKGLDVDDDADLVCVFVTTADMMESTCLGCVGAKGETFCTKDKISSDEQGTCGVNSHTKKAEVKPHHAFFQDDTRQVAYSKPALDMNLGLASCVVEMQHEALTRVQFRELVHLVTSRAVSSKEELLVTKERVMDPAKGVSFTPRKKPRFSSDPTWEYAEADILPSITEAPEAGEDLQEHIVQNWSAMLRTVETVKAGLSKQKRYETEIVRLGEDINDLRSLASRLLSLVGQPAEGMKYDLFAILDGAEERFMEVEDKVRTDVVPRVEKLEVTTSDLSKDIRSFKKNIGTDVTTRLQKLEASVQAFELASSVGASLGLAEIRTLLVSEIMPAMRDLWNLYMVVTKCPGQAVRPGAGDIAGDHLFSRLQDVEVAATVCRSKTSNNTASKPSRLRSAQGIYNKAVAAFQVFLAQNL
jgi:hypothetical protein